jgi:hypothetical protein
MMQSSILVPHFQEHMLFPIQASYCFFVALKRIVRSLAKSSLKVHMYEKSSRAIDSSADARCNELAMHVRQNKTLNLNPKKTSNFHILHCKVYFTRTHCYHSIVSCIYC